MKNNFLKITALICLAVLTSQCQLPASNSIDGNGNVVTRTYDVTPFDEISVSLPATVNYTVANEYSCKVRVDENLFEYLDIRVKDGELILGKLKKYQNVNLRPTEFVIEVSAPSFEELNKAGSGTFNFVTPFEANKLEINLAGSGKVLMEKTARINVFEMNVAGSGNLVCNELVADRVDVDIAGSGDVNIKLGNIREMEVSIAGSGSMDSRAELEELDASVAGSGDITAKVNRTLEYSVMGSGSINYYGNPVVKGEKLGSGKVKQLRTE